MRVNIDPAWCHQLAIGIDFPFAGAGLATHLGDPGAIDRNITSVSFRTGSIDDRASADDDIMHRI
jgi:hypothetical protein